MRARLTGLYFPTDSPLGHFTMERIGRLATTPIKTITLDNEEVCANDCLKSSSCLSFNYDFGESRICQLLKDFEGPGIHLHQVGRRRKHLSYYFIVHSYYLTVHYWQN